MGEQTAVVFLSMMGFAGVSFPFCSYWVYHYVDLEYYDTRLERGVHEDNTEKSPISGSENGPIGFRAGILK